MGKYRSPLLTIWRRRAFFDLKERGTGRMTEMQMLPEQARIVFDAVLRIDLQNGTYKTVSPCTGEETPGENGAYAEWAGRLTENADGENRQKLLAALGLERVQKEMEQHGRYEVFGGEDTDCKRLIFLRCGDGRHAMMYVTDLGRIADYYKNLHGRMEKEQYKDPITGGLNRSYYEKKLRDRRISGGVAVIDIDDFKLCNDTYGHDAGDAALSVVAQIIRNNIAEQDMLVRFGGDELLLLLPTNKTNEADHILESIRREINTVQHGAFGNFRLSASIGCAMAQNEPAADAVYRADRIMYRAKNKKNTVITEWQLAGNTKDPDEKQAEKQLVLIVDDSVFNRELLGELLGEGFEILEAANGRECMELLTQYGAQISVVLLDIIMPVMDGFAVLEEMGEKHLLEDIPVIMITADDDADDIRRAFEMGVTDFIWRPFDAKVVRQRIRNTVKLYAKQRRMLSMLSEQAREKEKNSRIMIDIMSNVVECINGESAGHILRMKKITMLLLERLILKTDRYGLAWKDCGLIAAAATLHDIGKVRIDPAILNKPGKLTEEEYAVVKQHTVLGEEILKSGDLSAFQDEPQLKNAIEICRWHHERYDGRGYPDGLSGDDIPIAAQVAGIADVFDALVSVRSYKDAYTPEEALRMIRDGECGCFNPLLVECLTEVIGKAVHDIYQ